MTLIWKHNSIIYYKTLTSKKPSETPVTASSLIIIPSYSTNPATSLHFKNKSKHYQSSSHSHENQRIKSTFIEKLKYNPLQMLKDDGDWSEEQFWYVLKRTSTTKELLQVFDLWKNKEKSRINEFNYEKIIGLLVDEGLIEEAVLALGEMKRHGLGPSLEIYNSVIHGFARKGRFEDASAYLTEMGDINLKPDTETYDGLIKAYGKYNMYDEMGQCVKNMEFNGCSPDHITYNLLIREFSLAGLLKKVEATYQTLLSKRMGLQSSTLIAMLNAYAKFGILDKMETIYRRLMNSRTPLKEDLIWKIAGVYIENHMFSRLENLGFDISPRIGRTGLVWSLRILSHACLLSRKGMNSVVKEMESSGVSWNVTVANIILLAYLKMKDFTHLKIVISELPARYVKPDIVTVGVLFDACIFGFDGMSVKNAWRRMGFFDEEVEMNTDPLVFTAFGKGHFLRSCEEMHSSKARKKEVWTYRHLINSVFQHNKRFEPS